MWLCLGAAASLEQPAGKCVPALPPSHPNPLHPTPLTRRQVESRYFMPLPAGEDGSPGVPSSLMIPVVEFTNHADSCRDVEGQDDSGGSSGSGADSSGGRSDGGAGGSGGANAGDAAEPAEPACAVASFPKIENSTFLMRALRPIAAGQVRARRSRRSRGPALEAPPVDPHPATARPGPLSCKRPALPTGGDL